MNNKKRSIEKKRLKEMQLKLFLCQLQADIGDLVENYSKVAEEYFNSELTVKLDFKIKEL